MGGAGGDAVLGSFRPALYSRRSRDDKQSIFTPLRLSSACGACHLHNGRNKNVLYAFATGVELNEEQEQQ